MKRNTHEESRMSLQDLRVYLREHGYKASHTVFKGVNSPIPEAVYVWGDGCEDAAKLAMEMGYDVKKDKQFKRYEIY